MEMFLMRMFFVSAFWLLCLEHSESLWDFSGSSTALYLNMRPVWSPVFCVASWLSFVWCLFWSVWYCLQVLLRLMMESWA